MRSMLSVVPGLPAMWRLRISGWVPALVWIGAIGAAAWLYASEASRGSLRGVMEAVRDEVGPLETARLATLLVREGQEVRAGEAVAQLDGTLLDAELAAVEAQARAELAALDAQAAIAGLQQEELCSTLNGFQQEILQLEQRFTSAVMAAETELRNERNQEFRDRAELELAEARLKRGEELLSQSLVVEEDVEQLRLSRKLLASAVSLYPESLRAREMNLAQAKAQQAAWRKWLRAEDSWARPAPRGSTNGAGKPPGEPQTPREECGNTGAVPALADPGAAREDPSDVTRAILKKIDCRARQTERQLELLGGQREAQAQRSRLLIEQLRQRRAGYTLRAPRDGVVAGVLAQPGAVVLAGHSVLSIVAKNSTRIVAFLPEGSAHIPLPGGAASVSGPGGSAQHVAARVVSLSPEVLPVAGRAGALPGPLLRGRRVILELLAEGALLPGEAVAISTVDPWWRTLWKQRVEAAADRSNLDGRARSAAE